MTKMLILRLFMCKIIAPTYLFKRFSALNMSPTIIYLPLVCLFVCSSQVQGIYLLSISTGLKKYCSEARTMSWRSFYLIYYNPLCMAISRVLSCTQLLSTQWKTINYDTKHFENINPYITSRELT